MTQINYTGSKNKGKYVQNRDASIYYVFHKGEQNKPTVTLIHGQGGNLTGLQSIADLLEESKDSNNEGIGTLRIDLRGHGKSARLENENAYTLDACTSDLEKVLDNENIEKTVIVGHSMGSMIAQDYAVKHPEKVEALVLISSSYNYTKSFCRGLAQKLVLKYVEPVIRAALRAYNKLTPYKNKESYYMDYTSEKLRNISDVGYMFEQFGKSSRKDIKLESVINKAVKSWDTEETIRKIKAPTLLIYSDSDPIVPYETGNELHKMIPNSEEPVIVENASHGAVFQKPELMTKHIKSFLDKTVYKK